MKVKTIKETTYRNVENTKTLVRPVGAEVEHKDAWRLCLYRLAEPADAECFEKLEAEGWSGLVRFKKPKGSNVNSKSTDGQSGKAGGESGGTAKSSTKKSGTASTTGSGQVGSANSGSGIKVSDVQDGVSKETTESPSD